MIQKLLFLGNGTMMPDVDYRATSPTPTTPSPSATATDPSPTSTGVVCPPETGRKDDWPLADRYIERMTAH